MVHHGQGLAFGLEAGDDLAAVHAGLDDLERDLAADRLLLLGHVDDAHAAFADLLEQLVRADDRAGLFRERRGGCRRLGGRSVQDAARGVVGGQEGLDALPQRVVAAAGALQVGRAFGPGRFFQNSGKKRFFSIGGRHGSAPETGFSLLFHAQSSAKSFHSIRQEISRPDAGRDIRRLKGA